MSVWLWNFSVLGQNQKLVENQHIKRKLLFFVNRINANGCLGLENKMFENQKEKKYDNKKCAPNLLFK